MRFALASFAAVAAATLTLAQPRARAPESINPPKSEARHVDWANLPAPASAQPATNAKRFAQHLPPLAPRAQHRPRGVPHRLGTRVQAAPRAATSPLPPANKKCNILVKTTDNTVLGFVSRLFNIFGEYGVLLPIQEGALEISFTYSPDMPSQIDLFAANTEATNTFPYVGGVVGFASTDDNFGPGSYNYAYVAGTSQTPPGSPAVVGDSSFGTATGIPGDYESAIWIYDPATQAITAQWINTDGSAPATSILYADDGNDALLLTGDAEALRSTFGTTYPDVTLTCVSPTSAPARR